MHLVFWNMFIYVGKKKKRGLTYEEGWVGACITQILTQLYY